MIRRILILIALFLDTIIQWSLLLLLGQRRFLLPMKLSVTGKTIQTQLKITWNISMIFLMNMLSKVSMFTQPEMLSALYQVILLRWWLTKNFLIHQLCWKQLLFLHSRTKILLRNKENKSWQTSWRFNKKYKNNLHLLRHKDKLKQTKEKKSLPNKTILTRWDYKSKEMIKR